MLWVERHPACFTLKPLYVQLPNFISQSWSSNGNQVMSILQVDLKIPERSITQSPGLLILDSFAGTIVWFKAQLGKTRLCKPNKLPYSLD